MYDIEQRTELTTTEGILNSISAYNHGFICKHLLFVYRAENFRIVDIEMLDLLFFLISRAENFGMIYP